MPHIKICECNKNGLGHLCNCPNGKHTPTSRKIQGLIALMRPFTLITPFFAAFVYAYVILGLGIFEQHNLLLIITAAFALALLNAISNAINQLSDIKEDKINKPNRPLITQDLTELDVFTFVCYGMLIEILILTILGNIRFALAVIGILFFAIIYSLYPRTKRLFIWNNLTIAIPRGLLGAYAIFALFGVFATSNPYCYAGLAIAVTIFVFGGNTTKDIKDETGDKQAGIRNFVTVYGVKKAMELTCVLTATSIILLSILAWYDIVPKGEQFLIVLLPLSFVYCMHEKWKYSKFGLWNYFYLHFMLVLVVGALLWHM